MKAIFILIFIFIPVLAFADLSFNGVSRIIFFSNQKDYSFKMNNPGNRQILAQAWITDLNGKEDVPFALSPALVSVDPDGESKIMIMAQSASLLRQDRESAFYFFLNEVPEVSQKKYQMNLAIKHRFYLFYRPESIKGNSDDNVRSILWQIKKEGSDVYLEIINSKPFYYSLSDITFRNPGRSINVSKHTLLPPFSTHRIKLNVAAGDFSNRSEISAWGVSFKVITDIGRTVGFKSKVSI
ncbi:fimbrial biogenesis chaperone [Citrobacter koseri]|uniref:fimbrial biogenesis chaperone n=1 Tax=Citrobacter koseri TaxID=545 RepID=UPI0028BE8D72|nr:fimbria/pilus periplasmic chaperone [Citrobacter koseri]MDT7487298.1 fimbria/pilus periplasmic chaperone [Citrobacter koseri]